MHPPPVRRRQRRRPLARAALVLVVGVLLASALPAHAASTHGPATTGAATATDDDGDTGDPDPLQVVLTSMSPSVVPRSGVLTLRGSVHNASREIWRDLSVSATTSTSPITSAAALRRATASPADSYVGDRRFSANTFQGVGDLDPGESTTFTLRIPRAELGYPNVPGVYWIGVQVLGTDDDGRDGSADGRARTFIPLLGAKASRVPLSLVVPIRSQVRRDADLSLTAPGTWDDLVGTDGRLGRLLALGRSAGPDQMSLLVDPAVPEAVETLSDGNRTDPTPSPSASASPSPSASPSDGAGDDPAARRARAWLADLRGLAGRQQTFGLGYADPDVAALAGDRPSYLARADRLSTQVFTRLGISATPAVAPPEGALPSSAVSRLDRATTVFLGDRAATGSSGGSGGATSATASTGQDVVLADTDAAGGGPAPGPTTSALAVRQRVLAEAALRSVAKQTQPLVVVLPPGWDPGPSWRAADLFGGLDRPWLRLRRVDTSGGPAAPTLDYPASAARARLGRAQLRAAQDVGRAVQVYVDTLAEPGRTADLLARLTLGAVSIHERDDAGAPARTRRQASAVRGLLAGIKVELADDLITMAGGSGTFVVTLANELDQPVRVGLRITSAPDLRIRPSPRTSVVPAGKRVTVRLKASADATGVRVVGVRPTTTGGAAIGTPVTFSVRSSQVSNLVWAVMAGAAALLVITIVRRALRRGLRRRDAT